MSSDSSCSSVDDDDYERWIAEDEDCDLFAPIQRNDAVGVRQTLRNGGNVNCMRLTDGKTPLIAAGERGHEEIIRILLEAGANARWKDDLALHQAIWKGHLSIFEILVNHDNDLLEIKCSDGSAWEPLLDAFNYRQLEIAHFLMDRGANALMTDEDEKTTLMLAFESSADLRLVRRLLAAGVSVEARDRWHRTALFHAESNGNVEAMRELIVEHNANMFALDKEGETPFDRGTYFESADGQHALLIECYGNKLTQEHGRLALHAVIAAAEYSFIEDDETYYGFVPHPNPLQIHLPLGKLTSQHFRTLLSILGIESIRTRDDNGKLPIHIACQNKAPVEVLALIVEHDVVTLHVADNTGALPLHYCCRGAVDDSTVRFLVEHGGVSTLATRNQDGAMPLHLLCGSTNPSPQIVQYLIQSFPTAVAARTNAGQYPFMIAADETSTASLSVVYELVRANPRLARPN